MDDREETLEQSPNLEALIETVIWVKGLVERWSERLLHGVLGFGVERLADDGKTPLWKAVDREVGAEYKLSDLRIRLQDIEKLAGAQSELSAAEQLVGWVLEMRSAHKEQNPFESDRLWKELSNQSRLLWFMLDERECRLRKLAGQSIRINPLSGFWGAMREDEPRSISDDQPKESVSEPVAEICSGDSILFGRLRRKLEGRSLGRSSAADIAPENASEFLSQITGRIERLKLDENGDGPDFPTSYVFEVAGSLTPDEREDGCRLEECWGRLLRAARLLLNQDDADHFDAEEHDEIMGYIWMVAAEMNRDDRSPDWLDSPLWTQICSLADDVRGESNWWAKQIGSRWEQERAAAVPVGATLAEAIENLGGYRPAIIRYIWDSRHWVNVSDVIENRGAWKDVNKHPQESSVVRNIKRIRDDWAVSRNEKLLSLSIETASEPHRVKITGLRVLTTEKRKGQ